MSIKLMWEMERHRIRPFVVFDLDFISDWVHAVMRNTGITPAYDITLTIEPALERKIGGGGTRESALTRETLTFLAPGREIFDFVCPARDLADMQPAPVYQGAVRYSDGSGASYEESFTIDTKFSPQYPNFFI